MSTKNYKPEEVEIDKIIFGNKKTNQYQDSYDIFYKKKDNPLSIKTGKFLLDIYGIPKPNDYRKSINECAFIKLPLNNSEGAKELKDFCSNLDKKFSSKSFRKEKFGKNANDMSYLPTIKETDMPKDVKEETEFLKRMIETKYIRMNFKTIYQEKSNDSPVKIDIVLRKIEDKNTINVPVKNILDVVNEITFGSEIELVFQPFKMWESRSRDKKTKKFDYGILFRIKIIRYKKGKSSSNDYNATISDDEFSENEKNSDDEISEDEKKSKKKENSHDEKDSYKEKKSKKNKKDSYEEKKSKKSSKKDSSDEDEEMQKLKKKSSRRK